MSVSILRRQDSSEQAFDSRVVRFKQPAAAPLRLVTVAELPDGPPSGSRWVVDGLLIAGGVSLFGGRPKSGKSTIVRTLLRSVVMGEPFLGRRTATGRVLYF